ncbi:MAG: DUF4406 domain-containing protein [Firmicutes bacterium]|nr:DUF4406 domain-containing protein [Bacillota bacterium]
MNTGISRRNSEGYSDPTAYLALTAAMDSVERTKKTVRIQRTRNGYRPLVYICSPLAGDMDGNMRRARRFCRFALERGAIPIAPHLLFPQFMDEKADGERGLALHMGLILLDKCSELWYFGTTVSPGMKAEIRKALYLGMHIRRFTECGQEIPL